MSYVFVYLDIIVFVYLCMVLFKGGVTYKKWNKLFKKATEVKFEEMSRGCQQWLKWPTKYVRLLGCPGQSKVKVKVKCTLVQALRLCTGRTAHTGSRGTYSSALSLTTALEGGEGSASRRGHSLSPGNTRYTLYRRLGGFQGRSGQVRKISPPLGFNPCIAQPVASRLYRLIYPGHTGQTVTPNPFTCNYRMTPLTMRARRGSNDYIKWKLTPPPPWCRGKYCCLARLFLVSVI